MRPHHGDGAGGQSDAQLKLDNVTIDGCPRLLLPTLTKNTADESICQGNYSELTFTFAQPHPARNVGFLDTLPEALEVDISNGVISVDCTTGSSSGHTITAEPGNGIIQAAAPPWPRTPSCSFSVYVKGTTAEAAACPAASSPTKLVPTPTPATARTA